MLWIEIKSSLTRQNDVCPFLKDTHKRINRLLEEEEEKVRLEVQHKLSLQMAQMRDVEERERYRLCRIANVKGNSGKKMTSSS